MKTLILSCMLCMSLAVVGQEHDQELKLNPEVESSLVKALEALEQKMSTVDVHSVFTKEEWNAFHDKYEPVLLELQNASLLKELTKIQEKQKAKFQPLEDALTFFSEKKEKLQAKELELNRTNQKFIQAFTGLEENNELKSLVKELESSEVLKELMMKLQKSELVKVLTTKK